ncbi:hypothetical protein K488DRAFT_88835 [Vararia minispora EC-137]|uniref:Uncharacterized protein n=1 Tax=Vararia minispora EC-137 TaxID=1314806 RepID=A0ACB8QDG8_9AGAM|nr:hypothetical protein K488DRAFT_88835 [Vararia minispora EC-137]
MFGFLRATYQRARTLGHQLFHHFGVHCATHQIRVILISGVVITSLFYPALAVYSSSQPKFLAHFSSQILDPFMDAVHGYYAQHDLVDIWSDRESIRVREDSVARARCGIEQTLRAERVMIHGGRTEHNVLDRKTLLAALELEKHLSLDLASRDICLRRPNGQCLAITPLEFWRHDERVLRADDNVVETISGAKNVTVDSVPIFPSMVFVGRGAHSAQFMVFTYFFPETDCLGDAGHLAWRKLLLNTTEPFAYPFSEEQEPRVIELTYDAENKMRVPSPLTVFMIVAYMSFAAWMFLSLRSTPPVHNPLGVIFTGIVEVVVSTITSLSVYISTRHYVYWSRDNAKSLVKTSIALPVKERIGEGLSRAGTSNSFKVLAYNVILGIIAFFARGAIRQFCAFAVVVLVAHWFLVHTFFVAVLSIDLQRMELEELLQQNASETLAAPKPGKEEQGQRSGGIMGAMKGVLRGRATTNVSLLLLLSITIGLYFATAPSSYGSDADLSLGRDALLHRSLKLQNARQTPAYHTWRLLNPADEPRIHIRVEQPIVLVLRPPGDDGQHPFKPRASSHSVMRTLTWLFRIVVLPYAVTLTALYALLLYLLKDADRLEAQFSSTEPEGRETEDKPIILEEEVLFDTLPRVLGTDVELLASSVDGNVVVAIGLASEAVVWIRSTRTHYTLETTDLLLRGASSSASASIITALVVNDDGTEFAVGTGTGVIALWAIENKIPSATPRIVASATSSAVSNLYFVNPRPVTNNTSAPPSSRPPSPQRSLMLAAVHENGIVTKWDTKALCLPMPIQPSRSDLLWTSLVKLDGPEQLLCLFALRDGTLEVHNALPPVYFPHGGTISTGTLLCTLSAGTLLDPPAHATIAHIKHTGNHDSTLLVAASSIAGAVSLWDTRTAECIAIVNDTLGSLSSLCLLNLNSPPRPCPRCRELPPDGFALACGIGSSVSLYSARASPEPGRLSCICGSSANGATWQGHGHGGRSHRPSLSTDEPAFPVSGHGALSRRGSEKDLARFVRGPSASESTYLSVMPDSDELSSGIGLPPYLGKGTGTIVRSLWKGIAVLKYAEVPCERGAWDVTSGRVLGIRRRDRTTRQLNGNGHAHKPLSIVQRGLSAAVRERWEVWALEPAHGGSVAVAPLASLHPVAQKVEGGEGKWTEECPRLPFTRVTSLVAGQGFALAAMGNSVGVFAFERGV